MNLIILQTSFAQYFPNKDVILNYSQIMFEYPAVKGAVVYQIDIAYNKTGDAKKDLQSGLFGSYRDSSTAKLISGLEFGKKYFWKASAFDAKGKLISSSPPINFALMVNDYGDSTLFRHRQTYNHKEKYRDGLIWCDTYHCAIDRAGNVVWLFPVIDVNFENPAAMRDLRLHNDGSISFFNDSNVYLINRDLTVLWNGPKNPSVAGQKIQHLHHTFNVVSPDNFYTLGNTYKKLFNKTGLKDTLDNYLVSDYVIQYDSMGTVKWSWNYAEQFFNPSVFETLDDEKKILYLHPHINALSVDSAEAFVYLSLRNLSRILKIEKSTKKIVAEYGAKFFPNDSLPEKEVPFNYQHDVKYIGNNRITLFNNNSGESMKDEKKKPTCKSNVRLLELRKGKDVPPKVLWEFYTNFDTLTDHCSLRLGSVDYINGNYLVCAGQNGRLFEVNESKQVVWDMIIYKKVKNTTVFEKLPQYRIMYSSSLYPYYFTAAIHNKCLVLWNEGTESDDYEITYLDKKNTIIFSQKADGLKPGEKRIFCPPPVLKKQHGIVIKSLGSKITKKLKT